MLFLQLTNPPLHLLDISEDVFKLVHIDLQCAAGFFVWK